MIKKNPNFVAQANAGATIILGKYLLRNKYLRKKSSYKIIFNNFLFKR
ncbi:MAG: hypothetical protein M1480_03480 [Bacteroidetes bacterium]|nr:hypothetical protein [Bacteroidota bacterium]